ncbi:glycoside hydrolase [Pontimonas sp.]|nr:sialidase family protein [Pontimonas sp.]MDA8900926.1 glycoside hydrolase [Pontimonas sp.]
MLLRPAVLVIRRVVVALVLSVFVGVTAIAQATPAWAVESWITPVDLSATGQSADEPQIVAAPNNTLTAIWYRYDGSHNIIQTSSSTDGGATWSSVVDLSATGQSAYNPQIVAAPNNTLTAIWRRYDGSKRIVQTRSSTDGGATWSSVVDLSATGQYAYNPQIVAAPNNTLTAIWYRYNGSKDIIQSSSLAPSSSSSASASADAGVPGIFLTVAGPVGRSASQAPVYYGADRVAVTSTYLLTVTRVSNITPTITTLAEGTIDAHGSFSSMTRLPVLAPGTYNVQMVGTHVNGSTLQLTSQVTIGGVGEFTSIGGNIPVIK